MFFFGKKNQKTFLPMFRADRMAVFIDFPSYSRAEERADRAVHVAGLAAALASVSWLLARVVPVGSSREIAAVSIYALGLIGMLSASAAYNLMPPGAAKSRLRRLDHSMIFVMIAGSYTPFALIALPPSTGIPLSAIVWSIAAIGVALKLLRPATARDRVSLALYLGMGWLVLAFLRPLLASVPLRVVVLLLAGGVVYSAGALVHLRRSLRFHNAIWHAMVVLAAAIQFAAVALVAA